MIASVMLPALGLALFGYHSYASSRRAYLEALDFRELRIAGDQLGNQLGALTWTWKTAVATAAEATSGHASATEPAVGHAATAARETPIPEDPSLEATDPPAGDAKSDLLIAETGGIPYVYVRSKESWARKTLAAVLDDLVIDRGRFGDAVLLTESGWVVHGWSMSGVSIADLVEEPTDAKPDARAAAHPLETGRVVTIRWQGARQNLFVQPTSVRVSFRKPGDTEAKEVALFVGGLVAEDRFDSESRRIPYRWGLTAIVLLALGLLTWPLLRLRLLGRHERLTAFDVRLVAGALVGLFGVWPAVLLVSYRTADFEARFDEQLPEIAQQVRDRFHDQLDRVFEVLDQIDRKEPRVEPSVHAADNTEVRVSLVGPTGAVESTTDVTSNEPPRSRSKAGLSVADREYFKAVERNDLWTCRPGTKCRVEIVRTRRQGAFKIIVAVPAENGRVLIGNIGIDPFLRPLLPPGIGFAIIDETGKVQLHSKNAHNVVENVYDEVDDPAPLKVAIGSQNVAGVTTNYGGEESFIRVAWLGDLPWHLLVFRSALPIQTAMLEAAVRWVLVFAFYALLALGCTLGWEALSGPARLSWLWPDRTVSAVVYLTVAVRLVVLAALLAVAFGDAVVGRRLVLLAAMPIVGLVSAARDLRRPDARPKRLEASITTIAFLVAAACVVFVGRFVGCVAVALAAVPLRHVLAPVRFRAGRNELRFRAAYVVCIAAILLLVSVTTATLLYQDAADSVETEALQAVNNAYRRSTTHGPYAVYTTSMMGREKTPFPPPPALDDDNPLRRYLSAWVSDMLPVYSNAVAQMRGARGDLPPSTPGSRAGVLAVVVIATLAAGLFTLAQLVVRLFHLDVDRMDGPDADLDASAARDGVFVFHRTQPCGGHDGEPCPDPSIRDLRIGGHDPAALTRWWAEHHTACRIALHHLETHLDDVAWQQAILGIFEERAFDEGRSLVVTSEIEPFHYLRGLADTAEEGTATGVRALLPRWSLVLSTLSKERYDLPPPERAADLRTLLAPFASDDATASSDTLEARHREVWRTLTRDERLVLRQLADEGFVSPAAGATLRLLMRRRLVRRGPAFEFVSDDFRRFVLRVEEAETVARWERASDRSSGEILARLLPGLLVGGLVFVFATQREMFNATMTIASAAGTALPLLLRVLGNVGTDRPASAAAPAH